VAQQTTAAIIKSLTVFFIGLLSFEARQTADVISWQTSRVQNSGACAQVL